MTEAPERYLRVQRHMACCGKTFTVIRDTVEPSQSETLDLQNLDDWAKLHRLTCDALKVTDDDT
ncbi:MAG: hypothetical protein JSS14_21955 [Proteobacteria bacterium]|nr:hypothetical protein [Pseudomonadota bacterium]